MATLGRAGSGPAEPSPATVSPADASRLVDLAHLVEGLKREPRRGWLRFGLPRPESVADHSWRLAFLAFVAGSAPGLDCGRCVRLALVHDVAECVVGDITPSCGVPKAEKHAREKAAVARMRDMLGAAAWAAVGADLEALWTEYEECSSPEALLVKDLDKLEMILQAHEYEQREGVSLDEFFRSTTGKFLSTLGRALQAEVVRRRAAAADAGAGGAAVAADRLAKIGDDLADLVASKGADGFGA